MYKLTKDDILTIPNLLSAFRIACIPVFAILYLKDHFVPSLVVLGCGMVTDLFDGMLARKLNQVSRFGIVLDPLADKLTQGVIVICLLMNYPILWWLLGLIIVKEGFMLSAGFYSAIRYDVVPERSEWYGKVCCVITDATVISLLVFPSMPEQTREIIILICALAMILTLILYARFYILQWKDLRAKKAAGKETRNYQKE